jgi:CheY-like chemotaxis protein
MTAILVVDDEFDSRRALEILLQLHGFEVTPAANGDEALQVLHNRDVDIIVTDWMMPVMSGKELIERIRADRRTAGIPIVVLTAAVESVRSQRPPCALVMGKPYDIWTLLDEIARITGRH